MANTASAKKALKSSLKKRVFNIRRTRAMKDAVKEIGTLISAKNREEAIKLLPAVYQALDKAAKRGVIKPNAASRKKSRITAKVKALA